MSRNNTQTGGMIAEEKQLNGTANIGGNSLGSYFQGVASYLPSSIKKQLHISPTSHHHSFDDDHDIVLGAEFDKYETPSGELHLCLMLSYNNGFQVWDLQHPEGKKEIVSVREPTPIKSIKFLPTPLGKEPPNSLLAGKRPLLAVVSAEESTKFPRTNVKFFSLRVMDYINILRFKSPVYSLECNNRLLLVGLRDNIYGFDLITMERVLSVPCYPSPSQSSVMALGPRWLAYAANQTMAPTGVISPQSHHHGPGGINSANSNLVEVAKDVASDLAKEVASGLFYLGDMGRKTVSNYLYPEDQMNSNASSQAPPIEYKDTEHAGTIIILDIVTKKPILHFRAHSQPLSVLRFDPSGTILVTSSVDGHNFNVYQLGLNNNGSSSGGELSYRHLYKLVRGVTNATIQDISFSADSKWMAISSTRGTTHIYAISPQGGGVNVLTHVPATNRPPDLLAPHKPDLPVPLMTLSVCNRIKTKYPNDEGSTRTISAIGSTSRFVGLSPADERLIVFAKNGLLTLYQLIPHAPNQPDIDPLSLQLAISPITESDMARRTKWNDYRQPVKEPVQAVPHKSDENDMKWLSNVEISTHSPHLRLLWLGCPQFSFRTYQPTTAQYSSSPAARSDMSSPVSSYTEQDLNSRGIAIPKAGGKGSAAASPNNTMEVLFDENAMIPTRRIDIRRRDPLPFKDSLDDLHDTSCSPQTDDLIKESLLDAISTPMVPDDHANSPTFELLNPIASSTQIHKIVPSSFTPPTSSPPSSFSHNSSHVSTSTSTLLPPPSESTNSYTGTIPNYYSPYTPPSQHKSTTSTTTTSVSSSPPANINPLRTAMSSPLVTSPRVSMSPPNHSPASSSPKMTSVQTSPTQTTAATTTTTATTTSPVSRPIPISSSAGIKNSPPYSTSPPFPESDLPVPKKNGNNSNNNNNNNNSKSAKAEEEEEDTTRSQTSKKKKKKGKNRNNDHEGEVET